MKRFFKILGGLFALLLITAAILIAMNWSMVKQIARFSPIVMPAFYFEPETIAEARRQDLKFLTKFLDYDRSFSASQRKSFLNQIEQLEGRAHDLSDSELFLGVAKAVAKSDNGHSNAGTEPLYRQFNHANVKFYWFADGLYIVRAHKELGALVGARIITINAKPVEDLAAALRPYFGGANEWRRLYSPYFMESPEILHAAGLGRSPDTMALTLVNRAGAEETVTLAAMARDHGGDLPLRRPWMTLKPVAMADEGDAWRRTLDAVGTDAPLYLRETDINFVWAELQGGAYVRPQLLMDQEDAPIAEKFEEVIIGANDKKFDFLAVDLRWSPGGDYTQVLDFVKAAPKAIKHDGRLYIIVGPQTFSAAIITAAYLKHYGGKKAVIIGSRMGDREQFWAERGPLPFELPNSKYTVGFATGYHDWANGCAGKHEYCFSQNLLHEVPAGSLRPSIVMEPTYADYASGRDIIMDYVLAEN
jgi:hypothetical protein